MGGAGKEILVGLCDVNWSQVGLKACDNLYTAWLAMNLINDNYCLHLEDYSGCKFYTCIDINSTVYTRVKSCG